MSADNQSSAEMKVWAFAMEIYRDEEKVRDFLNRKHPLLDNQRPIDVAATDADRVIDLLGGASYGGAA